VGVYIGDKAVNATGRAVNKAQAILLLLVKQVLLHEQSWLHTAIAIYSCTYTVCFYSIYTLAFVPIVFINI
jgi:hypothetical protein